MYNLDFITKADLKKHITETIKKYDDKLQPYNIKKLNKNIIDPIKLIFDKIVYNQSWEQIITSEIFRQRDKSNNNDIGYFHQKIFQYMQNCEVPQNGTEGGWDVIFRNKNNISLPDIGNVSTIYVEIKNKHNTMNSSSASKTFIKMQNQLLNDDDCACFLVEVIAKNSQNIKWETSIDKQRVGHKLIRRVSIDKFYEIITGDKNSFYKLCMVLPSIIQEVVTTMADHEILKDTAYEELLNIASKYNIKNKDLAMAMAVYMLGLHKYNGFSNDKILS